jgi:hypothetical protein
MTPTSSGRSSNAARSRTSTTLTTVMIQPEMVQPLVPVAIQKCHTSGARPTSALRPFAPCSAPP